MPYGLKRFQRAEALHFIPFSCLHRLSLPEAPELKETVEAILEQPWARHEARVYAYVLMPEHVHLPTLRPTHRDEAAMNGAQIHLSGRDRWMEGH